MTFRIGSRILCLAAAWALVAGCSEFGVQHVAEPTTLSVSPDRLTLYLPGEEGDEESFPSSSQVQVRVIDEAGNPMTGSFRDVRWEVSDPGVVSVDAAGRLTALSTGSATVRATSIAKASLEATMSVSVRDAGRADMVVK